VHTKDERRLPGHLVYLRLVQRKGLPVDGVVAASANAAGGTTELLALSVDEGSHGYRQRTPEERSVRSTALDQNDLAPTGINDRAIEIISNCISKCICRSKYVLKATSR